MPTGLQEPKKGGFEISLATDLYSCSPLNHETGFCLDLDRYCKQLKLGSLSTRTFEGDAAVIERLRLGRGLLRMTYPGLPTLCCRRRRELS